MRALIAVVALLLSALPATAQNAPGTKSGSGAKSTAKQTLAEFDMPDVVQHSLSDAQAVLSKAGVRSTARRRDGGVPAASDIVLWQFPLPKKKVTVGTAGVLYVVQRPVPLPVKPVSPQPEELTPPVIGLSSNDASALLKLRELKPSWTAVPSPDTALGSVIGQAPLPGRPIRKDRSIDLQIAGVPQVVGLAADAAAARLARAHLASTTITRELSSGSDGMVLEQYPLAGRAAHPGSSVALTIERFVELPFAMPRLVGRPVADARRIIADSRLVLRKMEIAKGEGSPGIVVGQSPVAGTIVRRGDAVTLTNGRKISTIPVPGVIGLMLDSASRLLSSKGLELVVARAREKDWPVGSVVAQRPSAGALVVRGTRVRVDTAIGPAVVVPNFVGARIDTVSSLPRASALRIVTRFSAPTPEAQDSVVVAQSLPPGTRAPLGSAITLSVSRRQTAKLVSLRIERHRDSLVAHDSVRLKIVGVMSDGSTIAVTPIWTASTDSITADGLYLAAGATGLVRVTARFNGLEATSLILVQRPWWWWWWRFAVIAAALAGLASGAPSIARAIRRLLRWPPPPPPVFTYHFKAPRIDTDITATHGHGSDLSLVSYAGESVQTILPPGVTLFDEEQIHG